MRKISFFIIFLLSFVQFVQAESFTKADADKAYQENKYAEAIKMYENILATQGESAVVYYNLGNSYFKEKNMAKAVLNYERALLLNPGDADIRFNLDMARSKTVDQITPATEVFIVTWVNSLTNMQSERGWAKIGIVSFICLLVGLALYIFSKRLFVRKIGFIGAIILLVVTVCANLFVRQQKNELMDRIGAIVMSPTVTVKSTPDESGTELFVLHEGTKVFVEDNSMKGWKEIRLEDGNKGWIPTEAIEII
uniref:tetratricopeptide repeat protein n=1 Tax=Phocaeicola coprophilus TaxID=387090 RepID=UPI00402A1910